MTDPHFPYQPDRDERYHFKMFDVELLRALGRLTLNASPGGCSVYNALALGR